MIPLGPGAGKCAYNALTDQSIAEIRAHRHEADPDLLRLAGDLAAILAEQFPADRAVAGRVVMAVAQIVDSLAARLDNADAVHLATDLMAFAAEQLVREGGGPS